MSLYNFISSRESWELFLEKEINKEFKDSRLIKQIKHILEKESYTDFTEEYLSIFGLAKKIKLSEINSPKKRIVYVYDNEYRIILKLVGQYMINKYNNKFCFNSLAYIEGRSVKSAFNLIDSYKITNKDTIYKLDFSDYFNSININKLEPILKDFLEDDNELFNFIMSILRQERVIVNKKIVLDKNKGVMAGSPIAGILANIYMHDVDELMAKHNYKYIRYADDVLLVNDDAYNFFINEIVKLDIVINKDKTKLLNIDAGITFLGFYYIGDIIDISPKSVAKMKSRFKRRAKWYLQWGQKNNIPRRTVVRDYIKKLNRKLYSYYADSINWAQWYLPNINTTKSLEFLDEYFLKCIRYLYSGKWGGKNHYKLSYRSIKWLGYKSLVNYYYKLKRQQKAYIKLKIVE